MPPNIQENRWKISRNSTDLAPKCAFVVPRRHEKIRRGQPWPREGRFWAQMGPEMVNCVGFFAQKMTDSRVFPLQLARGSRRSRPPGGDQQVGAALPKAFLPSLSKTPARGAGRPRPPAVRPDWGLVCLSGLSVSVWLVWGLAVWLAPGSVWLAPLSIRAQRQVGYESGHPWIQIEVEPDFSEQGP